MKDKHARFGGSNASRWIHCPGSVREISRAPEKRSSPAADHGRAAHFIAEACLRKDLDAQHFFRQWISADGILEKGSVKPDLPGAWFQVDGEMVDGVNLYTGRVRETVDSLPGAELLIETEVYPVPGLRDIMWGTADAIIIEPWGDLVVDDFKYGKGVLVSPEFNDQGMFYALGAMHAIEVGPDDIERVRIGIVQPRKPDSDGNVEREWATSPHQLVAFQAQLERAVEETSKPDAPLNPGAHCKFCPAELTCPALRMMMVREVMLDVPEDLDLAEVKIEDLNIRYPDVNDGPAIKRARALWAVMKSWGKRVEELSHQAANIGTAFGMKLVDGQGHRRWVDELEAIEALTDPSGEFCLSEDEVLEPRALRSPAQIEKIIRGKAGKEFTEQRTVRPRTAPKLVPDTDPRPAITTMMDMLEAVVDVD